MELVAITSINNLTRGKFYRIIDEQGDEYKVIDGTRQKVWYPKYYFGDYQDLGKSFEERYERFIKEEASEEYLAKYPNTYSVDVHTTPGEILGKTKQLFQEFTPILEAKLKQIETKYKTADQSENNGGSTDYYKINPEWKDLMDIIEERQLSYAQANILKAAFTFNVGRHKGTDAVRDLNKIIYFANRELQIALKKEKQNG